MNCNEEHLIKLADLFKVIGDMTRLNIVVQLFDKELSVNEIAERTNMSVSAISHQLKLLRLHKLVKGRREGKYTFYALDDSHVKELIYISLQHISE